MSQSTTRKILGSALAAFVGWSVTFAASVANNYSRGIHLTLPDLTRGALFLAVFFGCVWLVFLLPIYFLVPFRSPLWRWPVAMVVGTAVASLLPWIFLSGGFTTRQHFSEYLVVGAIMGGTTALFGSLTARFFVRPDVNHDHIG